MPRHARHDLRIDQFNTHFTRTEYRMFLALAQWRDQNVHEWLRETIRREYRQFQRAPQATRRAEVLAWVDTFLGEVDAEATARRTRAVARPRGESAGDEAAGNVARRASGTTPTRGAPAPETNGAAPAGDAAPTFAFISKAAGAPRRATSTQPLSGPSGPSGADAWARAHARAFGEDDGGSVGGNGGS